MRAFNAIKINGKIWTWAGRRSVSVYSYYFLAACLLKACDKNGEKADEMIEQIVPEKYQDSLKEVKAPS